MAISDKSCDPRSIEPAPEHVNSHLKSLGESATLAIHERSATLAAEDFLRRFCGDVLRAMELIVEWLGSDAMTPDPMTPDTMSP